MLPNCHNKGLRIPASRSKSLQSFTSAEMFPKAQRDCSRTISSLLFAINSINNGSAPKAQDHQPIKRVTSNGSETEGSQSKS